MTLLGEVAAGRAEFAFTPAAVRARAAVAGQRGLDCVLESPEMIHGTENPKLTDRQRNL